MSKHSKGEKWVMESRPRVVVPASCHVDPWIHANEIQRCLNLVARERCTLVVTLACGCPLIATAQQVPVRAA